jgi:hypothetical protein
VDAPQVGNTSDCVGAEGDGVGDNEDAMAASSDDGNDGIGDVRMGGSDDNDVDTAAAAVVVVVVGIVLSDDCDGSICDVDTVSWGNGVPTLYGVVGEAHAMCGVCREEADDGGDEERAGDAPPVRGAVDMEKEEVLGAVGYSGYPEYDPRAA